MPSRPGNPFEDYQPPPLDDIFSESGKIAIVQFKVERLVERAKREMLEGGNMAEFVDGTYNYRLSYDCASLEPLITFPNQETELAFVGGAVVMGIRLALSESQAAEGVDGKVDLALGFDDEYPRVANALGHFRQ